MAIKDLQPRQGNVTIVAEVTEKGEAREFQKFGKTGRVANAVVKDETGTVKLTLWNDDIEKVKIGDRIELTNGYVSEWQGEIQVTTGKFGALRVLEEGSTEASMTADEETEKEVLEGETSDEGEHILTEDEKQEATEDIETVEEEVVEDEEKE